MQQRPYYDRAMFWATLGAGVAGVGGIVAVAGIPLIGWPLLVVGFGMLLWALRLYLRHDRTESAVPREGAAVPKLDLTYESGKSPYFEVDEWTGWASGAADQAGNVTTQTVSSPRRWFRVGIKNGSMQTVEDVRVELASIDPPVIGHLPLSLSIMHNTPQPLTLHRANEPTYFADVILKLDADDRIHIMSSMPTPRGQGGIPVGRYRLGIRVTGRDTPAVTQHFVADVDDQQRLVFAQD